MRPLVRLNAPSPATGHWRAALLLICLLTSLTRVVDGVTYSTTATFQLKPFLNSRFSRFYSDLDDGSSATSSDVDLPASMVDVAMTLPQEGLESYYVEISENPFTIDSGGTINISLSSASSSSTSGDSGADETIPEMSVSTFLDYTRPFLITTADVQNGTLPALWNARREFFFLNQPRLHCLLNAPLLALGLAKEEGEEQTCDIDPVNNTAQATDLITDLYMLNDAVLELKIFQWDVWVSLTESLRPSNKTLRQTSEVERDVEHILNVLSGAAPFNLLIDSAKVCSAPALYTVDINNLIYAATQPSSPPGSGSEPWPRTIQITHTGLAQRIVAVLVQCSAVPVSVQLEVTFTNPNKVTASLETYFNAVMYFAFMAAYALLCIVYLTLIISCKRRQSKSTGCPGAQKKSDGEEEELHKMNDKEKKAKSSSSRRGSHSGREDEDEDDERRGRHARSRGDSSKKKSRSVSSHRSRSRSARSQKRRHQSSRLVSTQRPHSGASASPWRDHDDDRNSDDSMTRDVCVCCSGGAHTPHFVARLRAFFSHIYHTYTIIVMADGRMQWMVFVCLPVKCLMCIFFAASYSVLNTGRLAIITTVTSLPFVSLALGVAVGTILFALEMLVAVGWGLAFSNLTTAQIVVLAIGCILYFVSDICVVSTCPVKGRMDAFTANRFARQQVPASCIAFQYIKFAIVFCYHIYNLVQIFLVTRLLGHRAVKVHRDTLLLGQAASAEGHKRGAAAGEGGGGESLTGAQRRRRKRAQDRERARREKSRRRREKESRAGARAKSNDGKDSGATVTRTWSVSSGSGEEQAHATRSGRRVRAADRSRVKGPHALHSRGSSASESTSSWESRSASGSTEETISSIVSATETATDSTTYSTDTDSSRDSRSSRSRSMSSDGSDRDVPAHRSATRPRRRGSRAREQQSTPRRVSSVAAEGGLFPIDAVVAHSQATHHAVESMKMFLRYHGMRYPFSFIVLWQILFLCLSFTLYEPEHYFMKILFDEVTCIYVLCFIMLFLRKEPCYC